MKVWFHIISGPNAPKLDYRYTDVGGLATWSYQGGPVTGADIVKAWVDGETMPSNEASVLWGIPTLTVSQASDINCVNKNPDHTIIANLSLTDETGTLLAPWETVKVNFFIETGFGSPNEGLSGEKKTDIKGDARWTYTSNGKLGQDIVRVKTLGNQLDKQIKKTWQGPPSIDFTADKTEVCVSADVAFTGINNGSVCVSR